MRFDAWDTAFVRAGRRDVHPVLADVDAYPQWWPRLRLRRGHQGWLLSHRAPGDPRRRRVWLAVTKERPELGVDFAVTGEVVGEAEWYYLDEPGGVVINHLLRVQAPDRGGHRVVAGYRASVRAALQELKARLEAGRSPGQEPDPQLLADQAEAIEAFRRGVQAHQAKVAAGTAHTDRGDGSGRR